MLKKTTRPQDNEFFGDGSCEHSLAETQRNAEKIELKHDHNDIKKITAQNIKSYAVMYRQFNIF